MPQVHHVKSARPCKNPETLAQREAAGIVVGKEYFWWTFYKSPPCFSRTRPKPSQLTRSKWRKVYLAQEAIDNALDADSLLDALNDAVNVLGTTRSEYAAAASAIEEKFKGSPTAEQCREKAERLDELSRGLGDAISLVEEFQECRDDEAFDDVKQEVLDLDWNMPAGKEDDDDA